MPRTDWSPLTAAEAQERALTRVMNGRLHGHKPGVAWNTAAVKRAALGDRGRAVTQTKTPEGDAFTPTVDPAVLLDWEARLVALETEMGEAGGKWSWGETAETSLRQGAKVLRYVRGVVVGMKQ